MKKQAQAERVAAQNGMAIIWWRWSGQMESDKHMFPAFFQIVNPSALKEATPEDLKKMISSGYGAPAEKIELVEDASRMKYIQRMFENGRQLIAPES
jgi:hypothetical protein